VEQLPDEDLQIGVLLALLQDDAKNQASWLTWAKDCRRPRWPPRCAANTWSRRARRKLSGAWGRHPLLGRMYLPAYRVGTERVAELRRRYTAREFTAGAVWLRRAGGHYYGGGHARRSPVANSTCSSILRSPENAASGPRGYRRVLVYKKQWRRCPVLLRNGRTRRPRLRISSVSRS